MDRKQLTASIAGAALVAASLFGAAAAAQTSGDVTVNDAVPIVSEPAVASDVMLLSAEVEQPAYGTVTGHEGSEYEENEAHEYEEHEDDEEHEYEEHEYEEHEYEDSEGHYEGYDDD